MSSGSLPLAVYHRTHHLGSGSYGSVVTVYNDDGDEYALKLFDDDDDDQEEEETGISIGALREISVLRLLRGENAHPNIISMHDVQTAFGGIDEEDGAGAGTQGYLSIAMPLFPLGSLADCFSRITNKAQKVKIAHGIISAVAYLHENSIMHRDIKSDNILLKHDENDGDDSYQPVLIDFSLAKVVDPNVMIPGSKPVKVPMSETETTHTPEVGTPTYRAPEVIEEEEYSFPSDMWSVGVVLLELLRGKCLEAFKDKGAISLISDCLESLPSDQPFPCLIRSLLERDPDKRLTARQALDCPLFQKFSLQPHPVTFRRINIKVALPFDDASSEGEDGHAQEKENGTLSNSNSANKNKKNTKANNKRSGDSKLAKRFQKIQKICHAMEWTNPLTLQAALSYSIQMSELFDDIDNLIESQALLDCIVLAHKFIERHLEDLTELSSCHSLFDKWDLDEYVDNESTLFMMMDFCLYPREFLETS